jgi:hypothetical protein
VINVSLEVSMSVVKAVPGVLAVLLLVANVCAQPSVDAKSLVGEWVGDVLGPVNASYTLTITKADGNRVEGKARAVGPRGGGTQYDIFGTVEGNVLKYHTADKDLQVELVVDGDRMNGTGERRQVGATGKFSLTRRK